jgi:protein TonB
MVCCNILDIAAQTAATWRGELAMAYLEARTPQDRVKSVAAVVAVHAVLAYAVVVGLQASGVIATPTMFQGTNVEDIPLDPPPPPDEPKPRQKDSAQQSVVTAPKPPVTLVSDPGPVIVELPKPDHVEVTPLALPTATPSPAGTSVRTFDPVGPKPRNDPGAWVTTNDYRSAWVNRGMAGLARFRVTVGADGRVKDCTITGSSGHPELDRATCDLVARRAKFEPGRDSAGEKTAASYSNAVQWILPD